MKYITLKQLYIYNTLTVLLTVFLNCTFGISSTKCVSVTTLCNIQIGNSKRGGRVKFATHFSAKFQLSCFLLFSTENISILTRFSPHSN